MALPSNIWYTELSIPTFFYRERIDVNETTKQNKNELLTFIFIGYTIKPNRTSFIYLVVRVPAMWIIKLQNAIQTTVIVQ